MKCSVCGKQKASLKERRSILLKLNYWSCQDCITQRREPRHIIILAGRAHGLEFVSDFIAKGRYCGKEITAKELTS